MSVFTDQTNNIYGLSVTENDMLQMQRHNIKIYTICIEEYGIITSSQCSKHADPLG